MYQTYRGMVADSKQQDRELSMYGKVPGAESVDDVTWKTENTICEVCTV